MSFLSDLSHFCRDISFSETHIWDLFNYTRVMSSYKYVDGDDEDEEKEFKQYEIKEGLIFLIELTPEILQPAGEPGSRSQLFEILLSINDLMSDLIITMNNTGVGIYFYNCEASDGLKSMKSTPGFYKLFRLNSLNLTNMKLLNDMILDELQGVRPISHFFKYAKPAESENLPLILSKILDECLEKKSFNHKKLIWMTTNDRPYTKLSTKENLWRIINDYYNYRYFIQPIFLDSSKPFNMSLYQDIFLNTNYLKKEDSETPLQAPIGGFSKESSVFRKPIWTNQIRKIIFRSKEIRRIQFACDLILSDGKELGGNFGCTIKGYALYSHQRISRDLLLYTKEETLKRVFRQSAILRLDNAEPIELNSEEKKSVTDQKYDSNIRKGFALAGGETLFLNKEQVAFLTNYTFDHDQNTVEKEVEDDLDDDNDDLDTNEDSDDKITFTPLPYLKLLGFRGIDKFQPYYNSGPATFITPDINNGMNSKRGGYSNSFTTLSSLYQSCVKLKKFAVLFGCPKLNSKPALYAMYPTRIESSTRNIVGQSDFPEGFLLIRMPWLDDIRSLPNYFLSEVDNHFGEDGNSVVSSSLTNRFKLLMSQFFYKSYNPSDFPNPTLNYFYKIIKHDLLQIGISDADKNLLKNDVTCMKLSELRSFLANDTKKLESVQDLNLKIKHLEQSLPKRQAEAADEDATKAKRAKPLAPELDDNAVLTAWKNNQWHQFTVPQLKGFQARYKEKITLATKKQDLIDNITKFLESRETIN